MILSVGISCIVWNLSNLYLLRDFGLLPEASAQDTCNRSMALDGQPAAPPKVKEMLVRAQRLNARLIIMCSQRLVLTSIFK